MDEEKKVINDLKRVKLSDEEKESLYYVLKNVDINNPIELDAIDYPNKSKLKIMLFRLNKIYGFIEYDKNFKKIRLSDLFSKKIKTKKELNLLINYLSDFANERLKKL